MSTQRRQAPLRGAPQLVAQCFLVVCGVGGPRFDVPSGEFGGLSRPRPLRQVRVGGAEWRSCREAGAGGESKICRSARCVVSVAQGCDVRCQEYDCAVVLGNLGLGGWNGRDEWESAGGNASPSFKKDLYRWMVAGRDVFEAPFCFPTSCEPVLTAPTSPIMSLFLCEWSRLPPA